MHFREMNFDQYLSDAFYYVSDDRDERIGVRNDFQQNRRQTHSFTVRRPIYVVRSSKYINFQCVGHWYLRNPKLRHNGLLVSYEKAWVAQAPGMPGTFPPSPRVSDPNMHYGTCVTHVPWCMPWSLTSGFSWSRWRGKPFPAYAQPKILLIW